jgi:glycosyltransferase involved in cell wall biosynthesis
VIHVHGRIVESQGSAVISVRVPKADAVIAASRAVAQQVCNAQARVIYAGIEIPETSRSGSGTGRVLGVAGRLAPVKGIAYLIRALVWLRQEFPDVRLEIAGDGPQRPALESEAVTLGLTGAISFLGWREDLPSLFSRWDVFVQPSLEEAFPVVTLEAMAAGLPVVATNAGGLPELVQDAETGLLVPPEDPPALADALRKLLADPVLRRAMGRAGHVRVRERFSVHRMTDEITQVYEDILRSRAC